jgi:hypothetical protein
MRNAMTLYFGKNNKIKHVWFGIIKKFLQVLDEAKPFITSSKQRSHFV